MNTTEGLLEALDDYAARFPEETDKIMRFVAFIKEHEDIYSRQNPLGHLTASAWVTSADGTKVLLAYHHKLSRWVQLGGHVEAGESLIEAALREACEESGMHSLRLKDPAIYDLDIHDFPAQTGVPAHLHFDVRFLLVADDDELPTASVESKEVLWIDRTLLHHYTEEPSVLRLAQKF